jgi:hypothetical protein
VPQFSGKKENSAAEAMCRFCVLRNLTSFNVAEFHKLFKRFLESVRAGLLFCNYV